MNKNIVLIITGVFKPEPIVSASLMADLALELSKHYKVVVLRPKPTRPLGFQMPAVDYSLFPYEVIQVDSYTSPESSFIGRFKESVSMGRVCAKYIEEHHNEICMIYNAPWHLFGRKYVAEVALKYRIPYATPVQDIYPESITYRIPISILRKLASSILLSYDKFVLKNAGLIHTISPKMVDFLAPTRKVSRDKFVIVRNWQNEKDFIEYSKVHRTTKKTSEPFTFMYLGNIGPLAGIDILFKALKLSGLREARLIIAGSGTKKADLQKNAAHPTNPVE